MYFSLVLLSSFSCTSPSSYLALSHSFLTSPSPYLAVSHILSFCFWFFLHVVSHSASGFSARASHMLLSLPFLLPLHFLTCFFCFSLVSRVLLSLFDSSSNASFSSSPLYFIVTSLLATSIFVKPWMLKIPSVVR